MEIIRGRLAGGTFAPKNLRYNTDCACVQQTYDGGATWTDNPGQDIRHADTFRLPPVVADDPRCQASANMSRAISDFLNEISTIASAATNAESMLTIIIGGIAVFFPEGAAVGVLALLALDLASTLFSIGFTVIDAAFTNTVYDQLTCIFDCLIEGDGQVTAEELSQIGTTIHDDIGGTVEAFMAVYLLLVGEVGLSNMGARGDAPADCDACDCVWCYGYLWQDCEPDSWSYVVGFSNTLRCDVIPHFWQGLGGTAPAALGIAAQVGDGDGHVHVSGFSLDWALDDAQGTQDQVVRLYDHVGGTLLYAYDSGVTDGGHVDRTTVHITGLDLMVGVVAIVAYARDYAVAYNFSLEGDGFNPFPTSNC